MTGVDASMENIEMAKWHASLDTKLDGQLTYTCSGVEDLVLDNRERFDGVVASEILEHVADPEHFVKACCSIVKVKTNCLWDSSLPSPTKAFFNYTAVEILVVINISNMERSLSYQFLSFSQRSLY